MLVHEHAVRKIPFFRGIAELAEHPMDGFDIGLWSYHADGFQYRWICMDSFSM